MTSALCCAPSPGPGLTSAAGSLPGRYWSTLSQDSESSARLYQVGCQIPKSNASIEELGWKPPIGWISPQTGSAIGAGLQYGFPPSPYSTQSSSVQGCSGWLEDWVIGMGNAQVKGQHGLNLK